MIQSLRGTNDIFGPAAPQWQELEHTARSLCECYGYREIRTPVIEETALFTRTIGEETDIVTKEMFSFQDRGERMITLRPEGTAPIVRAYLEHKLDATAPFQKLYYIGPMFRAERPQAGRLRQFHQIGVEAIGSNNPALDAEVIALAVRLVRGCGIDAFQVKINNLGCPADKKKLSAALSTALAGSDAKLLCDDCKRRMKTNPLRVIDCKKESCRRVVHNLVNEITFLCDSCAAHFAAVRTSLDQLHISYVVDPYIVRGLDYYTKTVFEITTTALGAQDALGAGGRYDMLVHDMGGPSLGACGCALGIERLLLAAGTHGPSTRQKGIDLFIAALGATAHARAVVLAEAVRAAGIACDIDYEERSLKAQMRAADKLGVRAVMIIGEDEIAKGVVVLRDMQTKAQEEVLFDVVVSTLQKKYGNEGKC